MKEPNPLAMKTLHFNVTIQAPRQAVWNTMLGPQTYSEWTTPFSEGCSYEGSWEEGSEILFLGPSGGGMKAMIAENRHGEYLSIRHLACFTKEKEDPIAEPSFEKYTFGDVDGGTSLHVSIEGFESYAEMFQDMWPRALQLLKSLCESERSRPARS